LWGYLENEFHKPLAKAVVMIYMAYCIFLTPHSCLIIRDTNMKTLAVPPFPHKVVVTPRRAPGAVFGCHIAPIDPFIPTKTGV
jgi:hypothetical protein